MRIRQLKLIHASIPLKKRIRHASHTRTENDTILVRCELDEGSVGWGEGLPRKYVTGETIDTVWQHLGELNLTHLAAPVDSVDDLVELSESLVFPGPATARDCFGNAALCALELAILDASARAWNLPLSTLIQRLPAAALITASPQSVQYSAAITAMHPLKTRLRAALVRANRFAQCKVKVGVEGVNDVALLKCIRWYLGPHISIRIDANEAWHAHEVLPKISKVEPFQIASVEQPIPHQQRQQLREIRSQCPIPIMLDESLCSLTDAQYAIDQQLCDIFNIRLSKCGGVMRSLRLAQLAQEAGLQCQLGCQVGETGILSAAGRHFASVLPSLVAVEGSFDRYLVKEPLTQQDLTFGYRGIGAPLTGRGLGIEIDDAAVQRVTEREKALCPR